MNNKSNKSIKNFKNTKQFLPQNFIQQVARGAIHEAVTKRIGYNVPNSNQIANQITSKILNNPQLNKQLDKLQGRINTQGLVTFANLEHDLIDWIPAYGPAILDAADMAEEVGMTGINLLTGARTLQASKKALNKAMYKYKGGQTKRFKIKMNKSKKRRRKH